MQVEEAVRLVSSKFKYRSDPKFIYDIWFVMKEKNGVMEGDCEDFALTVIWLVCDRNIFKFIFYFLILHKYRIYNVKTASGKHAVGYAQGKYFDNWTKEALSREELISKTGHKFRFFVPFFFSVIFLTLGLIVRTVRK